MGKGSKHRLTFESADLALNVNVRVKRLDVKAENKVKEVVASNSHAISRKAFLKEVTGEDNLTNECYGRFISFGYKKVDAETGEDVQSTKFIDTETGRECAQAEKSDIDILGLLPRASLTNFVESGSVVITGEATRDVVGLHKLYTTLVRDSKVAYATLIFRKGDPRYLCVVVPRELTEAEQTTCGGRSFMLVGKLVPRKIHLKDENDEPHFMVVPTGEQAIEATQNVQERAFVDDLVGAIA